MTVVRVMQVLTLAVAGCGGSKLPAWTAAQIGCPVEQIVIMNDQRVWTTRTWTASCQGKTYSCAEHHEGEPGAAVSCREVTPSE